jgi:hypothetical protein
VNVRGHQALRIGNLVVVAVTLAWLIKSPGLEPAAAFAGACVALVAHFVFERTNSIRLSIRLGYGSPFEETEPVSSQGQAMRYFSVGIKNESSRPAESCLVKLTRMKALDGREFKNVFLPIGLVTQQQQLQGRAGGPFNLRAGETKYVRVASLDETSANSEIALAYEAPQIPNLVPRGDYLLTLIAYGGSEPAEQSFRLFVDADGHLRMKVHAGSRSGPNKAMQATCEDARA